MRYAVGDPPEFDSNAAIQRPGRRDGIRFEERQYDCQRCRQARLEARPGRHDTAVPGPGKLPVRRQSHIGITE